jgi:folate-binding protein YgfZ
MIAIPYLSATRFSGTDAGVFLHNQLSADVLGLPDQGSTFACYCEPKGRVLALMLVYRLEDDYYIIMSDALAQTLTDRLRIYVMRSKVNIEILKEYTVSGLKSGDTPEPATAPFILIPLPDGSQSLALTRADISPEINVAASDSWKVSQLERGICWLSVETSAQFLPQMLGFDQLGAVNFKKGCYPGQEIVARTHYLGKVKRHARVLVTSGTICPGLMDKVRILSNGESYEAIVVDCGISEKGDSCLFVVTRMEPELKADQVKFQDQAWATM